MGARGGRGTAGGGGQRRGTAGAPATFQVGLRCLCRATGRWCTGSVWPGSGGEAPTGVGGEGCRTRRGSLLRLAFLPFSSILGQALGTRLVPALCQVPGLEVCEAMPLPLRRSGARLGTVGHPQLQCGHVGCAPALFGVSQECLHVWTHTYLSFLSNFRNCSEWPAETALNQGQSPGV